VEKKNQKTILVVDDNVTQLKIYKKMLSSHYALTLVKSAAEALKVLNIKRFDTILLDVEMPDISGFELLHEIRKNPRYMSCPVLIISGHNTPEFLAHAENSSASAVLQKPVDFEKLLSAIEKALVEPKKPFFNL